MEYLYLKEKRFFAQIAGGIEKLGVEELIELGAKKVRPIYRGVYFEAEKKELYKIILSATLFSRILIPLNKFMCHSTEYLYRKTLQFEWDKFLDNSKTFAISCSVSNSKIKHSKYAAQVLKDAIVDSFRQKTGERPSVDLKNPDVSFNLHIEENFAILSLEAFGSAMHKRGYRVKTIAAPIQETLAAAILRLSKWDGSKKLYDPFCGSGTFLCEAAMRYCNVLPSFKRQKFPFMELPDFDFKIFQNLKIEMLTKQKILPEGLISGSDISQEAIIAARNNIGELNLNDKILLKQSRFQDIEKVENSIIIANPPYGIRMSNSDKAKSLLKEFGDFLKQKCQSSEAYIYVGDKELTKSIGLKASWKMPLVSGALDGRLVKIDIY